MEREEWIRRVFLSSIPLRQLGDDLAPTEAACGCLLDYGGQRLILTVAHATGNMGNWAIETRPIPDTVCTELYQIGPMMYLREFDLTTGTADDVDLSYAIVPSNLVSFFQYLGLDGTVGAQVPRLVCTLDGDSTPTSSERYGFFGDTKHRPCRTDGNQLLLLEPRTVVDLAYEGMDGAYDVFRLPGRHPGDDCLHGCSGAPILGTDGRLVGLVKGGIEARNLIFAIPLRRYMPALDVAVHGAAE